MNENNGVSYGIHAQLTGDFPAAVERVKAALKTEGFGILTEIDVQKTLREKTGQEMEPYLILGACNPQLASRAIASEHEVGLLLPCNVLVHSCGGAVNIAAQDPELMMEVTQNDALRPIVEEAKTRLRRALDSLTH